MSNKPIMESEDLISKNPDLFKDVMDFHVQNDLIPGKLTPEDIMDLSRSKISHIREEARELLDAVEELDNSKTIDGCCDLIYVILGYCHLRGWDFAEAWRRVQRANMTKIRGVSERSKFDVVKPPGFIHPTFDDLV